LRKSSDIWVFLRHRSGAPPIHPLIPIPRASRPVLRTSRIDPRTTFTIRASPDETTRHTSIMLRQKQRNSQAARVLHFIKAGNNMRNLKQNGFRLAATSSLMIFALPAQQASAQQAPQASDGIVVTATKRTASTIQATPIAVQAIGGADLQAKGAIDFADFYRTVPGLSVQDEGPGDKRYV
ncbi:hypothetical protein KXV85_002675, partial [Aspergillus fumigatus]